MPKKRNAHPQTVIAQERPVIEAAKERLDDLLAETKALRHDLQIASERLAKASEDCQPQARKSRGRARR